MRTLCSFIRLVTIVQASHCHDPDYKISLHHCVRLKFHTIKLCIEMNHKVLGFGSVDSIEMSNSGRVLC